MCTSRRDSLSRQGGQGAMPAQGPLWLVASTKGMECHVGFHALEDGLRAKPAQGGRLSTGQ
jgi:hypothetical protein